MTVTSPGWETDALQISPREIERALMARNKDLRWANMNRRGYFSLELTPDRATSEWQLLDTVRQRSTALAGTQRMSVDHGANKIA